MIFEHPERLWMVVGIPLAVVASFVFRKSRPAHVEVLRCLCRCAVVAVAAIAAAGPTRLVPAAGTGRTVVVIDASRSVDDESRRAVVVAAAERAKSGGPVDVWTFGDTAERAFAFDANDAGIPERVPGGARASRLGDALRAALGSAAPGAIDELVVATDGAVPPLGEIPKPPTRTSIVPLASTLRGAVRLDAVRATSAILDGEPFELTVRGHATDGVEGALKIAVDGRVVGTAPFRSPPGAFSVSLPMRPLAAGRHVVGILAEPSDREADDNAVGCVIDVAGKLRVLVVGPEGASDTVAMLAAQGIDPVRVDGEGFVGALDALDAGGTVVCDRMPVSWLSAEGVDRRLKAHVRRGGGLVVLPSGVADALAPATSGRLPGWLPFVGVDPPPPPPPKEEKKPDPPKKDPDEGLKAPDPEQRTTERRRAPTLGLLIVLDASGSMKGAKLRLAKEAAIAAAEVLHEDDRIGVIAFNDRPLEVLAMTRAGDRADVVDRISRITAAGGTDFVPALDLARDVLESENLSVKHVVLVSDGESKPGRFRPRVEALRAIGATVTTVGIGYEADANTLTDIAVAGGSKYLRADNEREIPQLLVVEAERVVASSGARRREPPKAPGETEAPKRPSERAPTPPEATKPEPTPEPRADVFVALRADAPAAYLRGVEWALTDGPVVRHPVVESAGAWVTMRTSDGSPAFAHRHEGFGRVAMSAFPLEGVGAGMLVKFDPLGAFLAQVVRWAAPVEPPVRWLAGVEGFGRTFRVSVVDLDADSGPVPTFSVSARTPFGDAVPLTCVSRAAGTAVFAVDTAAPQGLLDLEIDAGGSSVVRAAVPIAAPPEAIARGGDAARLEELAKELDAELAPVFPPSPPRRVPGAPGREPAPFPWVGALPALLVLDIVLGRLYPPRSR